MRVVTVNLIKQIQILLVFLCLTLSFIAHSRMCGFLFGIPEIIDHLYRK